ncbi:MAG: ATP-dependent sacrificial sulfur transferase LarE [Roseburia sp.]|nr:ATP-dependent sacrificial sulfur transferase LarE [Roseburia sp.]MCM1278709.1 ATP-dependent sacrificial sulfur transferase LarE [Robinsoniella sp.]
MSSYEEKCSRLRAMMKEYAKQNVAVAFSGGVDSSLLLKMAVAYAKEQGTMVYGITADTELHPSGDMEIAEKVAKETGAEHILLRIKELKQVDILQNPIDRCYRCKKYLFGEMKKKAGQSGAVNLLEGTNADDLLSYRPGIRAIEELGVKSPLKEAGLTKMEVRKLASEYGISVADRPSAPCLATRFPYGETLTSLKLKHVEQGEAFLKTLGFYNVRLRVHGEIARIEVDEAYMPELLERKREVAAYLKELGYSYITLDLEGFRSGSMDIGLEASNEK